MAARELGALERLVEVNGRAMDDAAVDVTPADEETLAAAECATVDSVVNVVAADCFRLLVMMIGVRVLPPAVCGVAD